MANATVSRIGQINAAGDSNALFLKVFSGEVLAAFEQSRVTAGKSLTKTIPNGKTAQFPASGRLGSYYHVPGEELNFGVMNHAERNIDIEARLVAPWFLDSLDEAKNHYDVRSLYSTEAGRQLAFQWDQNDLRAKIIAARQATPNVTGMTEAIGRVIDRDQDVYANFISDVFTAAEDLDNKFAPADGRTLFVKPLHFYLAVQNKDVLNSDWGGAGSFSRGTLPFIGGMEIVKTATMPQADDSANTAVPSPLRDDFSDVEWVCTHMTATGVVKLLDLRSEMEYMMYRQGTGGVSSYAIGINWLRPECAVLAENTA